MTTRNRLRVIDHSHERILTVDEVQNRGNEIVTEITRLILAALNESVTISRARAFKRPLTAADIRAIRHQSRQAIAAWQKVDSACSEVLDLERQMGR